MRISFDPVKGLKTIYTADENAYNHLDHADICEGGIPERLFGKVLEATLSMREKILLTSKCGFQKAGQPNKSAPNKYCFSKEYFTKSVYGSLSLLNKHQISGMGYTISKTMKKVLLQNLADKLKPIILSHGLSCWRRL